MKKTKKSAIFKLTYQEISSLVGGKRERALRLYDKASFMDEQLTELQKILSEKGWTENYQNGENQHGIKKSSEADVYIALSKNYMAIMKQLEEIVSSASGIGDDPLQMLRDE